MSSREYPRDWPCSELGEESLGLRILVFRGHGGGASPRLHQARFFEALVQDLETPGVQPRAC